MAHARFQFTLWHLIELISVSAVLFAALRTPFWHSILALGLVGPGLAIDRAGGGGGILGAMLAGMIGFLAVGIAGYAYEQAYPQPFDDNDPPLLVFAVLALMGLIWGLFFGLTARPIVKIARQRASSEPLQGEACGPIYWRNLDDSDERSSP